MKQAIVNAQTKEIEIVDLDISSFDISLCREQKRTSINYACELEIVSSYVSDTVIASSGMSHRYSTDRNDQDNMDVKLNIIYNTPSILTQPWKTKDHGVVVHTRDEFITISLEIASYIEQKLFKCITLKMQLDAATTIQQIENINW